jgi:membrane protein YdbS with pleckstrin-like domain
MYERLTAIVLRWARVSHQPKPPIGAPGSVRTFRAGRNYYYFRLVRWGATQIGASIGIVFSIGFTTALLRGLDVALTARPAAAASPAPSPLHTPSPGPAPSPSSMPSPSSTTPTSTTPAMAAADSPSPSPSPTTSPTSRRNRNRATEAEIIRRMTSRMPPFVVAFFTGWFVPLVILLEFFGIAAFLVSLPFTYALVRVEFDQHWYIVTDRSLRIRTGVLSLLESTMSFANLQQVEVKQGPLQRLLGLADVRVRSAGGGDKGEGEGEPLHTGVFHSVENADEIRDLILARLRAFREAGLGDPEPSAAIQAETANGVSVETLEAAREILRWTRAVRIAAEA